MLSTFTIRFRNFIWFLIFTFTLYCMPHLETLLPYEIHISFSEAEAAEVEASETQAPEIQAPETQAERAQEIAAEEASAGEASSSQESSAEASSATSSVDGSPEMGFSSVSFKVDDFTGAAHLSYPIAVPPGRSGLAPQLSLSYTSSGGNGWVGVGWDIPFGYIQRRGPRKGLPKYDDTKDVYELNLGGASQELVCVANCPPGGGSPREYRLKIEGAYLKIVYYSDSQNYWEVWDKSGNKMRFGFSAASRIGKVRNPANGTDTYRWCLDRVDDPKTNYMEILYGNDEEQIQGQWVTYQIYLQEINYNGQVSGSLPHNHRVIFNLESTNRSDPIYNYRGGFKTLTRKRLSSIEIKTNGTPVRKYQLGYTISNTRSLLSSVTLYGNDYQTNPNPTPLPPTAFTYQAIDMQNVENRGFGEETDWSNPSAWSSTKGNLIRNLDILGRGTYTDVIDMDGDALPDRVVYDRWTSEYKTWKVYFNNKSSFDPGVDWPNPSSWDNILGNYIRNTERKDTYTDVIDMNGNGLPNRVVYDKDYVYNSQNPQPAYWEVYLNDGNEFQTPPISWRNPSPWSDTLGNLIRNSDSHGIFTDVIDMNGDGLPDRVVYDRTAPYIPPDSYWTVYFNNGSGFDNGVPWYNPSAWDDIWGNYIRNINNLGKGVLTDVIDMNGDGLPDRVVYDKTSPYDTWTVYFNNGSGFDDGVPWYNPSAWDDIWGNYIRNTKSLYGTYTDVIDMNADGLPDRVVYDRWTSEYKTWKVYFNNGSGFGPGVDWPNPSAWHATKGNLIRNDYNSGGYNYGTSTDVIDLDGDGLPDRVVYDKTSPYYTWSLYFNKGPVSDLLKKVENGIGGTTEITYLPSTAYEDGSGNKVNHIPFVVQTVRSYTQNDGRGNSYLYKYFYSDASYDPVEVEFRGFKKVTAYQMANPTEYESMTETEFHQDYYLKGKIQNQKIVSKLPGQEYLEGHKKEIANTWLVAPTLGEGGFPYLDTATTMVTDQGVGGPFSYSQTTKDIYDIRPYDQANQTFNLLREHKNQGTPEEIVTHLEYLENRTNWIFKPIKATVTDSSGIIASRKWMDYNAEGELTTEELCNSTAPNTGCINRNPTQNVITNYQYDTTYKVLNQIIDPRGYTTTITYDSTKTFVYETTKCIEGGKCFTTTTLYDPGTGNPIKVIPPHFQGTSYWLQTQYDVFGRKTLERLKDNLDPNINPIVDRGSTSYTYYDSDNANTQYVLKTGRIVIENVPERTLTLNGYTYFDGLGRTYFAKTDGPEGKTIAVETLFDNIGRVWKQSNPYFVGETKYYTVMTYDGLSRLTDTLKTDGYYIHTDYEGLRKVVSKQVTASDWQSTAYYYDLNQKLVKVGEGFELPGQETFTEYTYDILGNLTQVRAAKDASGNNLLGSSITTTMTYDSLLKKRSMTDPDMGYWTYEYDKMGNLITQTDAKNQTITFSYDGLNRLTEKIYVNSNLPERVVYTYDDPLIPNSKGKLTKVSHLVGNPLEEVDADFVLEYDLNQRATISKKKIGTEEKTFEKTYDSAGRVISITYPGNKTYSYEYDVAGDLLYVKDNATGNNLVEYSVFTSLGQHKFAIFPKPNNVSVKTTYEYYPETGRLKTLKTEKMVNGQVTATYQNLDYQQFDGVGNIKILADSVNNITHNYTYDHLNRLTLANGVGTNAYTQSYQYDRIGNITYKSDVGNYAYFYNNRPHAVRSTTGPININLDYDLNGNMISRLDGTKNLNLTYNYDNKPELIKKDGIDYLHFAYGGNGQRVIKYNYSTVQSVIYFGDLLEIRPQGEVIHIYAGSGRVASVPLSGCVRFYHPNHLGSASIITDSNGDKKESIEYFPFGTYRDRQDFDSQCPNVNYTFTDQEDDDELGLYNYGARLYDPVLGRFISPDSIVQAPDDPQTLNRYSYARNNPIIYTDPSGNIFIIDDIILAIISVLGTYGVSLGTSITVAYTVTYAAVSAVGGAVLGAATSAITGGNIGLGALTGAISGLIFFGVGEFVAPAVCGALGATTGSLGQVAITTAVHTVAGAISGGINSAITGSNIGLGMLTGAVGAGIGAATGGALKLLDINQFGYQFVARTVAGGIAGGVVSEIYGGNFWQGFALGAATAAAAFLFNETMSKIHIRQTNSGKVVVFDEEKGTVKVTQPREKPSNEEVLDQTGEIGKDLAVEAGKFFVDKKVESFLVRYLGPIVGGGIASVIAAFGYVILYPREAY